MPTGFFLSYHRLGATYGALSYMRLEEQDKNLLVQGHWRSTVAAHVDEFLEIESLPDEPDDMKTAATLLGAIVGHYSSLKVLRAAKIKVAARAYPREATGVSRVLGVT
jgi:hypothetical protein